MFVNSVLEYWYICKISQNVRSESQCALARAPKVRVVHCEGRVGRSVDHEVVEGGEVEESRSE